MPNSETRASAESTAPDSSRPVTNHGEHPRQLGVMSGARVQSRAKPAATKNAPLLMTSTGTTVSVVGAKSVEAVWKSPTALLAAFKYFLATFASTVALPIFSTTGSVTGDETTRIVAVTEILATLIESQQESRFQRYAF